MKTYGLPEREYLKIYKMIKVLEQRFAETLKQPVKARRTLKKVVSLLKRAVVLENQMMVPKERRYTTQYQ